MAITNPQVVAFSNEKVRVAADRYAQLYWFAKIFVQEWDANNFDAAIPNSGAEIVVDGSATDGRTPITGAHLHGLKANLDLLVADLEAGGGTKLNGLSQIAVNETP